MTSRPGDFRRVSEPSPVRLIEEAVHLLRGADLLSWLIYYAGAGAWALGFLFLWARCTWFAPGEAQVAWDCGGLVALYFGMKAAQAEFCARLLARRLGAPAPAWSWRRFLALGLAQLRIQAWGAWAVPLALVLGVPFGWAYAFFQNASVLGTAAAVRSEAAAEAKRWPRQNHLGLLFLSVIGLAVLVNVGSGFYLLPWLANRLLGIQNLFGFTGWWGLNTTFLASVFTLTWLAVDPLVKAFYVLRIFYGRSQRTGDDLRVELRTATRPRRALALGTALLVGCLLPRTMEAEPAATPPPPAAPAAAVPPQPLEAAIQRVLERPEFQWRLRPTLGRPAPADKEESVVTKFIRESFQVLRRALRSVVRMAERVVRWVREFFPQGGADRQADGARDLTFLRVLLYGLMLGAAALMVWLVVMIVRQRARAPLVAVAARAVSAAPPNLEDEAVQAAQLPAEEWLALAREQMSRGEWRLALRALYLATLARLAAEGLLSLAKSKTNLDYERELVRRAAGRPEIATRFAGRRREFEAVWYGRSEPGEDRVRAWAGELSGGPTP